MADSAHPEDLEQARGRLSRLLEFCNADPDNVSLLADIADLALACGEQGTARDAVQHALSLEPGNPYFQLRLSSIAIAEGNYAEAIEITRRLQAQGQHDPAIGYNLAHALFCDKAYAGAREVLQPLFEANVLTDPQASLLIRACHYLGEIDLAIAVARQVLERSPDNASVAGMLSLLYVDANELPSAAKYAAQTLQVAPENLDALLAASTVALAAEDPLETRTLALRAISVQPQSGRAWANLGMADMFEMQLDAALGHLIKAVHYMPEHLGTWHMLGWVYLLKNDIDAAESTFNQALAIDENFGESHGALATTAAMRGDWELADKRQKIARRLNPQSMFAQYVELLRLKRDGHQDQIDATLKAVLSNTKAPSGGNLLEMLGRFVLKNNQGKPPSRG